MAAYNRRSFLDVLGAFSGTTLLSAFTRPAWSRGLDKELLRAENRPKVVVDAVKRMLDQGREPLRDDLARIAGCLPEEIAMQRNASEALETVIFGLALKAGDEVVLFKYDYPNCINAWKQRERRDGIRNVYTTTKNPDRLIAATGEYAKT